jgi:glycosyltransferase involved in cell wall biosynthesis
MHNAFDIGEYMASHLKLAKNIHVLGEVDEATLVWLYSKARAFVFPSLYEGWGLPPLEAMQHGCPVIASSAASIPESCGKGALYFDPKDTERLAMHLSAVALSEKVRQDLIDKGARRIQDLSWERCAKEHLQLLAGLVSSRP